MPVYQHRAKSNSFLSRGYDESTIGGYLVMSNNNITGCGQKENDNILIKTRGIINVIITDNTFSNNPVPLMALLWGVKNNRHRGNTLVR